MTGFDKKFVSCRFYKFLVAPFAFSKIFVNHVALQYEFLCAQEMRINLGYFLILNKSVQLYRYHKRQSCSFLCVFESDCIGEQSVKLGGFDVMIVELLIEQEQSFIRQVSSLFI